MAKKRGGRDPRYTRVAGSKPNAGRRFVVDGKVRIEWTEGGKRRSRTIGPNSANARERADRELERLLEPTESSGDDMQEQMTDLKNSAVQALKDAATSLMDAADRLVDWVEQDLKEAREEDEAAAAAAEEAAEAEEAE
jgi:flagellar hook-associated protein FlgK